MLHHPFVGWEDLLRVDGRVYESYVDAFHACRSSHDHAEDFYTDLEPKDSDSDSNSDSGDEGEDVQEEEGEGTDYPLADFEPETWG
jgi:hypothetical protein